MLQLMMRRPSLHEEIDDLVAHHGFEKVVEALHRVALDRVKGRLAVDDAVGVDAWLRRATLVEKVGA